MNKTLLIKPLVILCAILFYGIGTAVYNKFSESQAYLRQLDKKLIEGHDALNESGDLSVLDLNHIRAINDSQLDILALMYLKNQEAFQLMVVFFLMNIIVGIVLFTKYSLWSKSSLKRTSN